MAEINYNKSFQGKGDYAVIAGLFLVIAIIGLIVGIYETFDKDIEKIDRYWGFDRLTLVEAKHLWGWSWFNKNEISFGEQGLTITERTLLMTKTIQVLYARVKEIFFKEGKYISTMTVFYDSIGFLRLFGGKTAFNIKKHDSLQQLKDYVYSKSYNFSVVEKKSLLKSLVEASEKRKEVKMIMDITTFRKKYPQFDNMTDDELAQALHKKCCSEIPYEEFSRAFLKKQN